MEKHENPPIGVLMAILAECKMFDTETQPKNLWISGTYKGQAFTVQFNFDGMGDVYREVFKQVYPELG